MSPLLTILAFVMNLLSILFGLTSNSFILIWFSMEISMFSFLIILLLYQHNLSNSHVVKYFMFQSFSSVVLIVSLCKGMLFNDMIFLVTMMKLGAAPFHMWFMSIVKTISLSHFFWLSVPQKIIPLRLVQVMPLPSSSFNKILLVSVVLASLHMVTQFKFMKMLAASSIYITPWILFCFFTSDVVSWMFFTAYSTFQGLTLMVVFKMKAKADPLNNSRSSVGYFSMFILVLMMAGFPPSPLFFMKLSILSQLLLAKFGISAISLMVIASVSMYTYLNMISMGVLMGSSYQMVN